MKTKYNNKNLIYIQKLLSLIPITYSVSSYYYNLFIRTINYPYKLQ